MGFLLWLALIRGWSLSNIPVCLQVNPPRFPLKFCHFFHYIWHLTTFCGILVELFSDQFPICHFIVPTFYTTIFQSSATVQSLRIHVCSIYIHSNVSSWSLHWHVGSRSLYGMSFIENRMLSFVEFYRNLWKIGGTQKQVVLPLILMFVDVVIHGHPFGMFWMFLRFCNAHCPCTCQA